MHNLGIFAEKLSQLAIMVEEMMYTPFDLNFHLFSWKFLDIFYKFGIQCLP